MTYEPPPTFHPAANGVTTSRRHAEMIATAAASEARINELTEKLAESDWYVSQYEAAVDALRDRVDVGGRQVIHVTDPDGPSEDTALILDLSNGQVWERHHQYRHPAQMWRRADQHWSMTYDWPLDGARGPFVVIPDTWRIAAFQREVAGLGAAFADVRKRINDARSRVSIGHLGATRLMGGYDAPSVLADLDTVLTALRNDWHDDRTRADAAERRVRELEAEAREETP